jgi:hypothetical protein
MLKKTPKGYSRTDNTPRGGIIYKTPLTLRILDLLQTYECLPSVYMAIMLGARITYTPKGTPRGHFFRRLTDLRHEAGVIECPPSSWQSDRARSRAAIYSLTERGEQMLAEAGLYWPIARGNDHIKHKSARCITEASFAIGVKDTPGLSLVAYRDILAHPSCPLETKRSPTPFHFPAQFNYRTPHPYNRLVEVDRNIVHDTKPFAIAYTPEGGKTARLFIAGIEVDRNTEDNNPGKVAGRQTHNEKIIAALELHKHRTYQRLLGIPTPVTLFVTTSEYVMKQMMLLLEDRTAGEGSKHIAFKFVREFASIDHFPKPTGFMLTEPWQRVGHPPLDILAELGAK